MDSKHTGLYFSISLDTGYNTQALKKYIKAVLLQQTVCQLISRTDHIPNYPFFCTLQKKEKFMKENHNTCHIYL